MSTLDTPRSTNLKQRRAQSIAVTLWMLAVLFFVRVLGQAVQCWVPQSFLPPFSAFQGSGLPYPFLLSAQILILLIMGRTALAVSLGAVGPTGSRRKFLQVFGLIYLGGSLLRIVLGLTLPAAHPWFRAWIPEFFHLVIAAYVLTWATYGKFSGENLQHISKFAR